MIRIEGLEVQAGAFRLHIEELEVETGHYLTILGPTGAGKTVLLETIAGLRRPTRGHIWFGPDEVTAEPPEKRRVGFVYQDYALFPHLSVEQNIGFGVEARARRERARALARLLGIEKLLGRRPVDLSGGEQQRVALARALAIDPPVLLLDEPLSALDRETRSGLRTELKQLQTSLGTTVLHVTHDLDEALILGDTLAILIDGGLRQVGTPAAVVARPADTAVAQLVGATNILPVLAGLDPDGRLRLILDGGQELVGATGQRLEGTSGQGPVGLVAVAGAGDPPAPATGRVALVVRPEDISIEGPADPGRAEPSRASSENVLTGIVQEISLHSVYASVVVEVPPRFVVHVLRPDLERKGLQVGAAVSIRLPPSALCLCPDNQPPG